MSHIADRCSAMTVLYFLLLASSLQAQSPEAIAAHMERTLAEIQPTLAEMRADVSRAAAAHHHRHWWLFWKRRAR